MLVLLSGHAVPTSDEASFARQAYLVDAIMCGDRVVWVGRDEMQRQVSLSTSSDTVVSGSAGQRSRGNRLQNDGSSDSTQSFQTPLATP